MKEARNCDNFLARSTTRKAMRMLEKRSGRQRVWRCSRGGGGRFSGCSKPAATCGAKDDGASCNDEEAWLEDEDEKAAEVPETDSWWNGSERTTE